MKRFFALLLANLLLLAFNGGVSSASQLPLLVHPASLVAIQAPNGPLFVDNPPDVVGETGKEQATSLMEESNQGFWLVQATCLSISEDLIAQWRIDHVFNGPETLKTQQFAANHKQGNFGGSSFTFVPTPNEQAIWVVQIYQGHPYGDPDTSMSPAKQRRAAYCVRFPIGQNHMSLVPGVYSDYKQTLAFAQSVERVANAPRDEQVGLLSGYAHSSIPQLSYWAITTLAESDAEGARQILMGLVQDTTLSLSAQVALDSGLNLLDKNHKVQWSSTPLRMALWQRLVTSKAIAYEADMIVEDMVSIAQEENYQRRVANHQNQDYVLPITGEQLVEWSRLATSNEDWPSSSRARAVANLSQISREGLIDRAVLWPYLLKLLNAHPDFFPTTPPHTDEVARTLAESALGGLLSLKPLSTEEMATLRALQSRAKSPRLKFIFENYL